MFAQLADEDAAYPPGLLLAYSNVGVTVLGAAIEQVSRKHTVLQPAAVAEVLRVQNADVALDIGFKVGLGWMLSTLGGDTLVDAGPVAHHVGAVIHFRSHMYALPEHKLGVIVAANSSSAGRVVDTIATRALAVALEARLKDASLRPGRSPLLEVSEGEAIVLGPLADSGEVVRWRTTDDGLVRARFNGYEFRRKAK